MMEAMKRLDKAGFFGIGDERKNVIINVEVASPDYSEYNRALYLNLVSSLLTEYLENCEEGGEN